LDRAFSVLASVWHRIRLLGAANLTGLVRVILTLLLVLVLYETGALSELLDLADSGDEAFHKTYCHPHGEAEERQQTIIGYSLLGLVFLLLPGGFVAATILSVNPPAIPSWIWWIAIVGLSSLAFGTLADLVIWRKTRTVGIGLALVYSVMAVFVIGAVGVGLGLYCAG